MKIDLTKCIHCGTCFAVYENRVEQKDGTFVVKEGVNLSDDEKKQLIDICPVGAIGE